MRTTTEELLSSRRVSALDCEPLRAHARELYRAFEQHVIFEKRILAAALRARGSGAGRLLGAEVHAADRAAHPAGLRARLSLARDEGGAGRAVGLEHARRELDAADGGPVGLRAVPGVGAG